MARLTKQKKIEKLVRDQVDIVLEWYKLSEYLEVKEGGEARLVLFEDMMAATLKIYTDIEERMSDQVANE